VKLTPLTLNSKGKGKLMDDFPDFELTIVEGPNVCLERPIKPNDGQFPKRT